MHKYLLLILFIFLSVFVVNAQNKTLIKGRVVDSVSNAPFEFATVAVLDARDTTNTLITYALTDKKGEFVLHNAPSGFPIKIFISFVGYQPFRKITKLPKAEMFDLGVVRLNSKELQVVTIKAERMPVVIRKDTIEFDAEAFKTRPNAVVEDLLKKLPGAEVANDGKITFAGKDVSKIMVDGKEFFTNDPRIASKNLDADLIAKVQVYDDREDDPDHIKPDIEVKKIINLKFKKALKKSEFGKIYGGLGTNKHYQSGGLFNMFRDTLQISVLGSSNNLNNTGFDFNDLYTNGGLNRGGEAISRGALFGTAGNGKQTATNAGININTDYGKKLKINFAYLFKHTLTGYNILTQTQQILNDTTAFTDSKNTSTNTANTHTISSTVVWKPTDVTSIRYVPVLSINQYISGSNNQGNSRSNFVDPINNSVSSNGSTSNSLQFQQSFSFNKQLKKKGSSVNINHNLNISPGDGNSYENSALTSYISNFPSYQYRQQGNSTNRGASGNLSANYRYPLTKKLTADITTTADYNHSLNRNITYEFNPATGQYDSLLLVKSNDLSRNTWTETVSPGLTYIFPKNINLVVHLNTQWNQVNNIFNRDVPNIDQQYFFLLPNVNLNFNGFSLGYNKSVQLPNIGDMIPYTVVFSPLYSVTGNPLLKPTSRNNFTVNFGKFIYQKHISFNISANASFEKNSIFRERTLSADLAETSTPINRDGRRNFGINSYFNKQLKKTSNFQFNVIGMLNLSQGHDFFVLNHIDGFQDYYRGSATVRFSLNYKDVITLDPEYIINKTFNTYTGVDYADQQYISHNINTRFTIRLPQKFNIDGNYAYRYNPLVPTGFQKHSNLLSMSLAHQFLKKDRGEIKLSCYDILNQNISSYRSINENTINDTQSEIVKRYFMLTLQFRFNRSKVKDK